MKLKGILCLAVLTMTLLSLGCTASPFQKAVTEGDQNTVRALLQSNHGVAVNIQDKDGRTYLMEAAERGHLYVVNELTNSGAKLDIQDNSGQTALMMAAAKGRVSVVRALLEKGANISLTDNAFGFSALNFAQENGQKEVLIVLERAVEKKQRK